MDIERLKRHSDISHRIATEKKTALEKLRSRQTLVYHNQIFKADSQTIAMVSTMLEARPNQTIYVLDSNDNPAEITDPKDFLSKLVERNQESINEYHTLYSKFKRR